MARKFQYQRMVDGNMMFVAKPRLGCLKVNATYRCPMGCLRCNRACGIANGTGAEDLHPDRLEEVLWESDAQGKEWSEIVLTGGEPIGHPWYWDWMDVIQDYMDRADRSTRVGLQTHYGMDNDEVRATHLAWPAVRIESSGKTASANHRMNPFGDPGKPPWRGCHTGALCGTYLDFQGFWGCVCGGAIARVFGIQSSLQSPKDLSLDSLSDQWQVLCRHCGFHGNAVSSSDNEELTPEWQEALADRKADAVRDVAVDAMGKSDAARA